MGVCSRHDLCIFSSHHLHISLLGCDFKMSLDGHLDVHSPEFLASLSLSFKNLKVSKVKQRSSKSKILRTESSRSGQRACGRVLVILMNMFIVFQADGFLRFSLPWFALQPHVNLAAKMASVWLFVLIEFFYACTSLVDPGRPGRKDIASNRWCNDCTAPKPDRCHHCSTCSRCVLRMDHHCIFTNSCVGLRNQPYFLMFVFLTMLGAGLAALAAAPQVPAAVLSFSFASTLRSLHPIALCLSAAIAFVMLWNLLLAQMHLLIRNETTIESLKNWADRCNSSFDQGVRENIAEVFGPPIKLLPDILFDILDGLDQFLSYDLWWVMGCWQGSWTLWFNSTCDNACTVHPKVCFLLLPIWFERPQLQNGMRQVEVFVCAAKALVSEIRRNLGPGLKIVILAEEGWPQIPKCSPFNLHQTVAGITRWQNMRWKEIVGPAMILLLVYFYYYKQNVGLNQVSLTQTVAGWGASNAYMPAFGSSWNPKEHQTEHAIVVTSRVLEKQHWGKCVFIFTLFPSQGVTTYYFDWMVRGRCQRKLQPWTRRLRIFAVYLQQSWKKILMCCS